MLERIYIDLHDGAADAGSIRPVLVVLLLILVDGSEVGGNHFDELKRPFGLVS